MDPLHVVGVLLTVFLVVADSLRFTIQPNQKKCLREEIHKDVLVTGEYELTDAPGQKAQLLIRDSLGQKLYKNKDATRGRFSFVTEEYDAFELCVESEIKKEFRGNFSMEIAHDREVYLDIKHGSGAKNYADIAAAKKLKPLELEVRRLEDMAVEVAAYMFYMSKNEKEMQATNYSTHHRVGYLTLFSVSVVLALAFWQACYLRNFFREKKLID